MTTGQVAALLGRSRQGVVDLCERGELPSMWIGAHRRIRRRDVQRLLDPPFTREQERSLWLHRVVAGRLMVDPDGVLAKARANIRRQQEVHRGSWSEPWTTAWESVLDRPLDELAETLVSRGPVAVELRQNSPFAGVLTVEERLTALDSFYAYWRRTHAA